MSMNSTPASKRVHIGIFGKTNAGKSSIINVITGQDLAIVSPVAGTTTDPIHKAMELLPMGPVVFIDTAGIDDDSELGQKRLEKTYEVLDKIEIALLVVSQAQLDSSEKDLISQFKQRNLPYLVIHNKSDLLKEEKRDSTRTFVSAKTGEGIQELKEAIAALHLEESQQYPLIADLIQPKDIVVLVVPIDSAAPKGRLILPQQQTIREILEVGAMPIVCKESELLFTIECLKHKPAMVVTDSQVFESVSRMVDKDIPLTSFSILFARHKGSLRQCVEGLEALEEIQDGDRILIVEGCTHHRQCDDIGSVKLPKWIREYTSSQPVFEFNSGQTFEKDLTPYKLVVHCGGCMLTSKVIQIRQNRAMVQGVKMTNYGTIIAHMNGILKRTLEPIRF